MSLTAAKKCYESGATKRRKQKDNDLYAAATDPKQRKLGFTMTNSMLITEVSHGQTPVSQNPPLTPAEIILPSFPTPLDPPSIPTSSNVELPTLFKTTHCNISNGSKLWCVYGAFNSETITSGRHITFTTPINFNFIPSSTIDSINIFC
jgi:hypothetical protein